MKHTPGPWKFSVNGQLQAGPNGLHLGTFSESCGLGNAAEANKALITAAPDLLAALQNLLDALSKYDPDTGKGEMRVNGAAEWARSAVTKATGTS